MKIIVLSPTFPPKKCGVGDYTYFLCQELRNQGHQVKVITSQKEHEVLRDVEFEYIPELWGSRAYHQIEGVIGEYEPERVIIQFTPNIYGPRNYGFNWSLASFLKRFKCEATTVFFAHESFYPPSFSLRGLLIGVPQFFVFHWIVRNVDVVLFSYEAALKRFFEIRNSWFMKAFRKKLQVGYLPVGSNIPVAAQDIGDGIEKADKEGLTLLTFGGNHPTRLFNFILYSTARAVKKHSGLRLIFIGITQEEALGHLAQLGLLDLKDKIEVYSHLSAPEVSLWMNRSDIVLAPFLDGISTRRGSVIAAFAHGKCVLTTRGWGSESTIPWEQFCCLAPSDDLSQFENELIRLMSDPSARKGYGESAVRAFNQYFSWGIICQKLLSDRFESLD